LEVCGAFLFYGVVVVVWGSGWFVLDLVPCSVFTSLYSLVLCVLLLFLPLRVLCARWSCLDLLLGVVVCVVWLSDYSCGFVIWWWVVFAGGCLFGMCYLVVSGFAWWSLWVGGLVVCYFASRVLVLVGCLVVFCYTSRCLLVCLFCSWTLWGVHT